MDHYSERYYEYEKIMRQRQELKDENDSFTEDELYEENELVGLSLKL